MPEPAVGRGRRVVSSEVLSERGLLVLVDGDLDLATAPQLHAEVSDGILRGHRHFVIDLTSAEFLDSVAMQTLMVAIEPLRDEWDAAVVLAGAHGVVERALQVSGIGPMFAGFTRREDAIAAVESGEDLQSRWRDIHPHPPPGA